MSLTLLNSMKQKLTTVTKATKGFIFLTSQARFEVETLGQVGGTTMRTKDLRCYLYLLRLKCCHMVMVERWSVPCGHIPKRNWGRTKGECHHGNTSPSSSGFFLHPTGWHWVIQQTNFERVLRGEIFF